VIHVSSRGVYNSLYTSTASPLHRRHRLEQVEEQLSRVVEVSG